MTHYVVMKMTPEEIKTKVQEMALKLKLDFYGFEMNPSIVNCKVDFGTNSMAVWKDDLLEDWAYCSVYVVDECVFMDRIKSEKDIKQAFIHLFELNEAE